MKKIIIALMVISLSGCVRSNDSGWYEIQMDAMETKRDSLIELRDNINDGHTIRWIKLSEQILNIDKAINDLKH